MECPFCMLLVEKELRQEVGQANILGVPSCNECAVVAEMADDGGQWMVEKIKDKQA